MRLKKCKVCGDDKPVDLFKLIKDNDLFIYEDSCKFCNENYDEEKTYDYIEKCKEKYKDNYDYSKLKYIDSYHYIEVICKKHNKCFFVDPVYFISDRCDGYLCDGYLCGNTSYKGNSYINDTCNLDIKGKNLIFYKFKFTHKETGFEFFKVGVNSVNKYEKYKCKKYKLFDVEIITEYKDKSSSVISKYNKYINDNGSYRFYLPSYINIDDRGDLYLIEAEYQLKASHVKIVRDGLLERQNELCPLCDREVELPTLDHYHTKKQKGSGLVRGVLCNTCNRMVGVIENNFARNNIRYSYAPEFLRSLSNYLLNSREPYMHPSEKPKAPVLMKSSYNKLVKKINSKQKVPKYNGKLTKPLIKLYEKYDLKPEFKKSRT